MSYLRVTNLADVLTLHLLRQTKQVSQGSFVEETKYPWTTWYRLRKRPSRRRALIDWPTGAPEENVRDIAWPALLRKLGLADDPGQAIARDVVVRAPDKRLFVEIVREHVLLGQGWLRFAAPRGSAEHYLLRIREPALWSLMRLGEEVEIYNAVPAIEGLYLRRGHRVHDEIKHANLKLARDAILLFDGDASLREFRGEWADVEALIDLSGPEPTPVETAGAPRIPISLRLIDDDAAHLPTLFHVTDQQTLQSVLMRTPPDLLYGIQVWMSVDGQVWILADDRHTNKGLLVQFQDLFDPFVCIQRRVFVPAGKTFMPRLGEERIVGLYSGLGRDYLCALPGEDGVQFLSLPADRLIEIDKLVEYRAEQAVKSLAPFESTWEFDFAKLVARAPSASSDKTPGLTGQLRVDEPEQPATDKKRSKKRKKKRGKPTKGAREQIFEQLRAIDSQLAEHHLQAALWQDRADLSAELGHVQAAFVAQLTAATLGEEARFLPAVEAALKQHSRSEVKLEGFGKNRLTEEAKGRLLANIRRGSFSAEETYALQLLYAVRFHDYDVFHTVVESMHRGFPQSHHRFYQFEDYDASPAAQPVVVETLAHDTLTNIEPVVDKFLAIVEKHATRGLLRVITRQFNLLLRANGARPVPELDTGRLTGLLDTRYQWLRSYGERRRLPPNCESHTQMWLENVEMSGLRQARVADLFVGEVYRPVITWNFVEESNDKLEQIFASYSRGETDWHSELRAGKNEGEVDRLHKQRLLLYLVTRYGPLAEFEPFIQKTRLKQGFSFYEFIINCDYYRLALLYDREFSEDTLFTHLVSRLPKPKDATFPDYRDAVENLLLCLLLSTSNARAEYLEKILRVTLTWIKKHTNNARALDELLGLISYVAAGFLYRDLPRAAGEYRFYIKKKGLWMNHAHRISRLGWDGVRSLRPPRGAQ